MVTAPRLQAAFTGFLMYVFGLVIYTVYFLKGRIRWKTDLKYVLAILAGWASTMFLAYLCWFHPPDTPASLVATLYVFLIFAFVYVGSIIHWTAKVDRLFG